MQNSIGQFGKLGRNTLTGPKLSNTDLSLMKNFRFRERYQAQLRGEFYNAFNQVNFGVPVKVVTSSTFGRLTSAGNPRVVQFGLKVNF